MLKNVNMLTVSKSGRSYIPGKPLSSHLRHLIIDKIVEGGGDSLTMIFPGRFVDIANELNVSSATVSKIWKNYRETGSLSPLKHRGGNPSRLSNGDLELLTIDLGIVEFIKKFIERLLEKCEIFRHGPNYLRKLYQKHLNAS